MKNFKFIKVGDISIIESAIEPPLIAFLETSKEDRALTSIAIEQGSLLICTTSTELYLKAKVSPNDPNDHYYYWKILSLDVFAEKFTDENIGAIVAFPSIASVPPSYLVCDGSTFDAAAFPSLARILGSNVLPDLRDKFIKGHGSASPMTTGLGKTARPASFAARAIGTTKADGIHKHAISGDTSQNAGGQVTLNGSTSTSGEHSHANNLRTGSSEANGSNVDWTKASAAKTEGGASYSGTGANTVISGGHTHSFSGTATLQPHTHTLNINIQDSAAHSHALDVSVTDSGWDTKTEPEHYVLVYCIKCNNSNSPIKLGGDIANLPTNPAEYQNFMFVEASGNVVSIYYANGNWHRVSDNSTYIPV